MKSKINITSIKLSQLDSASLICMSKIARALKKNDGIIIKLHEQTDLSAIVTEAKRSNDPEVTRLYQQLKLSLRTHFD